MSLLGSAATSSRTASHKAARSHWRVRPRLPEASSTSRRCEAGQPEPVHGGLPSCPFGCLAEIKTSPWAGGSGCAAGQEAPVVGLVPPWPKARMITTRAGPQEESTGRPTGLCRLPVPGRRKSNGRPGGSRECRLATRPARGVGDPSGAGSWAAECRSLRRPGGQLEGLSAEVLLVWVGLGARGRRAAARRGRGDGQHLQAADRRLLSLICRPCQALGNSAQREYQAVPVDGAVGESSRGVPLAVAAQASPGGDPGATAALPVTVPARTAVHSG